jgi:hypothetical protein
MEVEMGIEVCCSCGISFCVPKEYINKLRKTHKTFWCPNGHSLHYPGKSEAEKLREQLATTQRERDLSKAEVDRLAGEVIELRKRKKRQAKS